MSVHQEITVQAWGTYRMLVVGLMVDARWTTPPIASVVQRCLAKIAKGNPSRSIVTKALTNLKVLR